MAAHNVGRQPYVPIRESKVKRCPWPLMRSVSGRVKANMDSAPCLAIQPGSSAVKAPSLSLLQPLANVVRLNLENANRRLICPSLLDSNLLDAGSSRARFQLSFGLSLLRAEWMAGCTRTAACSAHASQRIVISGRRVLPARAACAYLLVQGTRRIGTERLTAR